LVAALASFLLVSGASAAAAQPEVRQVSGAEAAASDQLRAVTEGRARPSAPFAKETCTVNLLLCGQVVSSELASTDCPSSSGPEFVDGWFYAITSRQAIGLAVSSPDFAPLTGIADPSGRVLAADDAPVGGIASVGVFASQLGIWDSPVTSVRGTPATTGKYLIALACGSYPCRNDLTTVCLGRGRYRVQVGWMNQFTGKYGFGLAIPSSDQAGFFAFSDLSNVELLVKVLDFGDVVKVFYGELTNLHFMVTVTDMLTNKSRTYTNTPGDCGGIDQSAFPGSSGASVIEKATAGACRPSSDTLCLLKGRFALKVAWRNQFDGSSGAGAPKPLSDLTGAFSFTDRSNLELLFKMIDFGDRVAVFYGTLSNLEYTATITDTRTGQVKTYTNPANNYCGGLDNTAFPE